MSVDFRQVVFQEFICAKGHYSTCHGITTLPCCPYHECKAPLKYRHACNLSDYPIGMNAPKLVVGEGDLWAVDKYGNRYSKPIFIYEPDPNGAWETIEAASKELWTIKIESGGSDRHESIIKTLNEIDYETESFSFVESFDPRLWHTFKDEISAVMARHFIIEHSKPAQGDFFTKEVILNAVKVVKLTADEVQMLS